MAAQYYWKNNSRLKLRAGSHWRMATEVVSPARVSWCLFPLKMGSYQEQLMAAPLDHPTVHHLLFQVIIIKITTITIQTTVAARVGLHRQHKFKITRFQITHILTVPIITIQIITLRRVQLALLQCWHPKRRRMTVVWSTYINENSLWIWRVDNSTIN